MEYTSEGIIVCPCCSQRVEGKRLLADEDSGVITNGEVHIRLRAQQFKLAKFLIERFPLTASKESIYDNVFMHYDGSGPEMKIVDVVVCHIRPHLAELGLVIETVWGKGYKLVEAAPQMANSIKDASVRIRLPGTYHQSTAESDKQILDFIKRKMKVTEIATRMNLPYMTVERAVRRLTPMR